MLTNTNKQNQVNILYIFSWKH